MFFGSVSLQYSAPFWRTIVGFEGQIRGAQALGTITQFDGLMPAKRGVEFCHEIGHGNYFREIFLRGWVVIPQRKNVKSFIAPTHRGGQSPDH